MWPHGEEWIHEAIADTYLPLLEALYDLAESGLDYRLTISVTPILVEQLADPLVAEHFIEYAAIRSAWACEDVERFEASGEGQLASLARFYHHRFARALTSFQDRFNSDLVAALRSLQEAGLVEISTSAATHGYLPLLSRDSSIYGQIRTGVESYRQHFGVDPAAIWLPECAYRPAYMETEKGVDTVRPGLEEFLAGQQLSVFFSETHAVLGGKPVGKAAGDSIGPYGEVHRRYSIEQTTHDSAEKTTTFQPYWVGKAPGEVAVLARNNDTGEQVWSASHGYPGDFWYREFHKKDGKSGLQYWRIGEAGLDLAYKPPYEPDRASEQVEKHAQHFCDLVVDLLTDYENTSGSSGAISAAYDTELFGHWWFEGVTWLKSVLTRLSADERVELRTASGIIDSNHPTTVLQLPESSWGSGGGHFTWDNVDTRWMWPLIHEAEVRMEELVEEADKSSAKFLMQAARELLLLQSSDWPFLVTTGQAKEYASERFSEHLDRFNSLADVIQQQQCHEPESLLMLEQLEERDNPFASIDPEWFSSRQGRAN